MDVKRNFKHLPMIALVFAVLLFEAACSTKIAMIGSPYDRYDHNRQQKIAAPFGNETEKAPERVIVDEVYIPFGSPYFPSVRGGGDAGGDHLPAANIVPIFTGLMLPLSDAAVGGMESDKRDLIDYLAGGPSAKDGVERTAMVGDIRTAEEIYKPILSLLGSKEYLSEAKSAIIKSVSLPAVDFADEVIDSRYSLSSFQDVLAVAYKDFWFILFKLPDKDYYSRLVVVPLKMRGQDFSGKRP
jgi:hypothetical protein